MSHCGGCLYRRVPRCLDVLPSNLASITSPTRNIVQHDLYQRHNAEAEERYFERRFNVQSETLIITMIPLRTSDLSMEGRDIRMAYEMLLDKRPLPEVSKTVVKSTEGLEQVATVQIRGLTHRTSTVEHQPRTPGKGDKVSSLANKLGSQIAATLKNPDGYLEAIKKRRLEAEKAPIPLQSDTITIVN